MSKPTCLASLIVPFALSYLGDAEACSCAVPEGMSDSIPAQGDEGVPTDVVPWAVGAPARLVDRDGNVVPTRRHLGSDGTAICTTIQELVPEAPLQPNSVYSITAEPVEYGYDDGQPKVVSFTTGDGLLAADIPKPPAVSLTVFDAEAYLNTCVYSQYQACLSTDHEGLLEVRIDGPDQDLRSVRRGSELHNVLLGNSVGDTCVEIRARDLAGRLSEPAAHCVNTEAVPSLAGDDSAGVVPDCDSAEVAALTAEPSAAPSDTEQGGPEANGVEGRRGLLGATCGAFAWGRRRPPAWCGPGAVAPSP